MSDHHGDDWDSEVGEGLVEWFIESGIISWPSFVVLAIGLTCLAYHFWG